MIAFSDLLPRLVNVTKITERDYEYDCPRCGGRATVKSFGRGWSAKCARCGNLGEDDFQRESGRAVEDAAPLIPELTAASAVGSEAREQRYAREAGTTGNAGSNPASPASSAAQPAHEEVSEHRRRDTTQPISAESRQLPDNTTASVGEADADAGIQASEEVSDNNSGRFGTAQNRRDRTSTDNAAPAADGAPNLGESSSKLGVNGAGGGRSYHPDVDSWKLAIYTRARDQTEDLLHKGTADSRAAAEMIVQSSQLENWIATVNQQRNLPQDNLTYDPALTPVEIDEEIQVLARALLERYTPLAVRNGNGHLVAVQDVFADRHAVDAYLAYEAMKGDLREYSWEGLIREGCSGVLSGLMSSGKTTLAMNLARGWALGEQVIGRQCKQSRTLVVVSPKEFEAWADTIGFWGLKGLIFLVESTKAHFADRNLTVRWMDEEMRALGCRTLILDTLFDFFGMPPNTAGDSNRIAMNEQTPLLQLIRERTYSALVLGHAPKSEAKAIDPRDPEESFGGHTAWTAQHRMRMTVRRKTQGINAFITGKGGYGDVGILKEQILLFDETSRLDSLGGLFADHLAATAMPSVVDALRELGEPTALSKIIEAMGKGEKWVKAGLRAGRKCEPPLIEMEGGKGKRGTKYRLTEWPLERDLF